MRQESIEEVQARIFKDVLNFEELPFLAVSSGASAQADAAATAAVTYVDQDLINPVTAKRARPGALAQRDIALGTVPSEGESDLKLAVLVQSVKVLHSPEVERIREIAGPEVDVVYIGRQQLFWTRTKQRPLKMGSSVSPASAGYSGTLGFFARDTSGRVVMVSNNHVLADVNGYPLGTTIVQQADGDGGRSPADDVGRLTNYVPIQFNGVANAVDAACAEISEGIDFDATTIYGNATPPAAVGMLDTATTVTAIPGLAVQKTGRTTGHTVGRIRAINVNNYVVNMGAKGTARFDGQLVFEAAPGGTTPFSRPGDSGSLICDANGVPVALLFAGSSSGGTGGLGTTGGNPISSVLTQLGVTFA